MASNSTGSPRASSLAVNIGVVLACFLVFAAIVGFAYLRNLTTTTAVDLSKVDESDRWKYTEEGRAARLAELRGKEHAARTSYSWIDQTGGVVRLPITRAMELVVAEQQATPTP
jgi:hypothetical protein